MYLDVEEFIDSYQNDTLKELMWHTHQLLLDNIPNVSYSIKYKVPFYQYKKAICYINPQQNYIILGFVKGRQLSNHHQKLVGEQKMVRHYLIKEEKDIYDSSLLEIINEALILDINEGRKK